MTKFRDFAIFLCGLNIIFGILDRRRLSLVFACLKKNKRVMHLAALCRVNRGLQCQIRSKSKSLLIKMKVNLAILK